MNFYHYISDSKVDMILPTIPMVEQKEIASEINVNLGIFKLSRKEQRQNLDSSVARLRAAEKYIIRTQSVGSIDEPATWIRGELEACIQIYPDNEEVVFFVGETEKSIIVLGGSTHHIYGDKLRSQDMRSMSFTPRLISTLVNRLELPDPFGDQDDTVEEYLTKRTGQGVGSWITQARNMVGNTDEIKYPIKFLAKRLIEKDKFERKHILATPLYVSMSE